jgi:CheY-like chemotaxis protein
MLRISGYTVYEANSGNQALELLKSDVAIDLVLSDIRMPDGDGFSLLAGLKGMELNKSNKTPLIFFSAEDARQDQALAAGAKAFLSKPLQYKTLNAIIEKELAG